MNIIPLREMEGNYNVRVFLFIQEVIIPLREMEGNYNRTGKRLLYESNYTLERDGRELQRKKDGEENATGLYP